MVTLPVGWSQEVPLVTLKRFVSLAALAEAKGEKIFLHCLRGRDRTGEVTAAYLLAKKTFDKPRYAQLTGPLRLIEHKATLQTHFERTLSRAKKYQVRHP